MFANGFPANTVCIYCGQTGNIQREHVISCASTDRQRRYDKQEWIVPACAECNNLIGGNVASTVPARAKILLAKYRKRFAKILKMPEWSDAELAELSPSFRASVMASLSHKHKAKMCLKHLEEIAAMPECYGLEWWKGD